MVIICFQFENKNDNYINDDVEQTEENKKKTFLLRIPILCIESEDTEDTRKRNTIPRWVYFKKITRVDLFFFFQRVRGILFKTNCVQVSGKRRDIYPLNKMRAFMSSYVKDKYFDIETILNREKRKGMTLEVRV